MNIQVCDHCQKKVESPLSLIGRISGRDEQKRDFCSVKCLHLWVKSVDKGVLLVEVLKQSEETEKKAIPLYLPVTVKELAAHLHISSFQVISDLMEANIYASGGTCIEPEAAERVALRYGVKLSFQFKQGQVA